MDGKDKEIGSLYAITGPYTDRIFPVKHEGGLIGRSRKCPVSLLHDCEVSHNHAMVEQHAHAESGFCIRDIGSTFGTYLNDKRLSEPKRASEPYKLKPGDTVKVGQTTLKWQPRQHLDAAAIALRVPMPPHNPTAYGGADAELAKLAETLKLEDRSLCDKAATVELAVVARRLEQLLRVHAHAHDAPAPGGLGDAGEWRALLRAECESLRRDTRELVESQRNALKSLLGAQVAVWAELRSATAELAGNAGGAPPLSQRALQWLRDVNHHARWGYRVVRQAQLWLDALEGTIISSALAEASLAPALQRQRMLDADARTQHAALLACLSAEPVDGAEALDARERLAVSEWELLQQQRAQPALASAEGERKPRPALAIDPAELPEVTSVLHVLLLLPWSRHAYRMCAPPSPPARALAGGAEGCFGCEATLDDTLCILQPCHRPAPQLATLHRRLTRLALAQASGAPGTQHVARLLSVWRETADGSGALWVHLAHPESVEGGHAALVRAGMRADARAGPAAPDARDGLVAQIGANWRRSIVELGAALSTLSAHGLSAAGLSEADVALTPGGSVALLSLGLARLGSAERPVGTSGWRWAAIPPEAHDLARGELSLAGGGGAAPQDGGAAAAALMLHLGDDDAATAEGQPCAPPTWAADVWGLGVLLWRIHFGDDCAAIEEFLRAPRANRPSSVPLPARADAQLASLLRQLLCAEPLARLSPSAVLAHPLLLPLPPTSRAASLPDSAAALLSADDDAPHVAAAIAQARRALGAARDRVRADAEASGSAPAVVSVRAGPTLCSDMLAAVAQLSDAQLLAPLALRVVELPAADETPGLHRDAGGADAGAARAVSAEEMLERFWTTLLGEPEDAAHRALFDSCVCVPLGVRPGDARAPPVYNTAEAAHRSGRAHAPALGHGAPVLRANADVGLCEALGRLLFKCLLEGLPLPLSQLPAYWWRAAVGMCSACGLPELEPISPLLALEYSALIASGTTDGWSLDFEQVGMGAADVPQARKLEWLAAKLDRELRELRAAPLAAMHVGFARAAGAPRDCSILSVLQQLSAEALMLSAAAGMPAAPQQLQDVLAFRDFPDSSQMPANLLRLIDVMSGIQLRRFILLLTGFVELPLWRLDGAPTVITVKYWPSATDCAPVAHRAALTLDLPWYSSFEKLRQMISRTLDDNPETSLMASYELDDHRDFAARYNLTGG